MTTERQLVRRAQDGDRQALSALWDTITPKLFGYLVNVTRDKTTAEDIFQTTWLKVIESLPKFKQRGFKLSSWIFAIARNECHQYWRKSRQEVPFDITLHDVSGGSPSDDEILVDQILASLSKDDREIIRLRYIADMSVNDIAKVLNINFVAVRVRLHRALARARSKLISQNNE